MLVQVRNKAYLLSTSTLILIALLIIVSSILLSRLVNLSADFPPGITTSGELYSDEGWYSASAIRDYLTGEWYLPGDINTVITQPGAQVLYRLSFSLFGLSLFSVRIVVVISFILLVILLALWVRKYYSRLTALLAALLISTNFLAFAYSRLALRFMIALLFITASLFVTEKIKGKRDISIVILASLLLAYGILTYTTTVFAIPLLLFLFWKKGKNQKAKLHYMIVSSVVLMIIVGAYFLLARAFYPVDVANDTTTVRSTLITSFSDWPRSFATKSYSSLKFISPDFTILTILLTIPALFISKQFRTNPLVQVMLAYLAVYLLVLSINKYSPPRYYLLLLLPFTGLCAIACVTLTDWFREHYAKYSIVPILLVVLVSLHGSWRIITYLAKPEYSFYQMAQGVKNIIQEREGTQKNVLLFGDFADSISLEAGTNSVNNGMWTRSNISARLKQYRPNYLLVHTSDLEQMAASSGATITELGRWDVFHNYYANGEQVRLYYAFWPEIISNSGTQP